MKSTDTAQAKEKLNNMKYDCKSAGSKPEAGLQW